MKRSSLLALIVGASSLVACDGLKEALTAHVDVVARAASQELSVTRLSDLLGNAKIQIPINKDVATLVARDLWVPYQLLGAAAAKGDSLNDPKLIDAAASGMIDQAKLQKFMEHIASTMPSDTGSTRRSAAERLSTLVSSGAPDRIRTYDLRLRRPSLYPAELGALARLRDGFLHALRDRARGAICGGFVGYL